MGFAPGLSGHPRHKTLFGQSLAEKRVICYLPWESGVILLCHVVSVGVVRIRLLKRLIDTV